MTRAERLMLADIRRAVKALDAAPTHETHPWTEPDDVQVLVSGCPRCEAIGTVWANATDWIPFLLKRSRR